MNMIKFLFRKWQCCKTIILSVKHKSEKGWDVEDKVGLKIKEAYVEMPVYIAPKCVQWVCCRSWIGIQLSVSELNLKTRTLWFKLA